MRLAMFFSIAFAIATLSARADGPQIQITAEAGKIATRSILLDEPYSDVLTPEKTAYVIPVRENLGVWYARPNNEFNPVLNLPTYYSGPGIAYGYGYDSVQPANVDFATGSVISLAFTAGLRRWDGITFVDAGTTEIEAFRGSFAAPTATARTSDLAPFASIAFAPVDYAAEGADVHNTARFRLLGDGSSPLATSPDAVYLVGLQFTTTQTNLAPSDPFYFILNKNMPSSTVQAAVAALGIEAARVQFVPEPRLLGVSLLGAFLVVRRASKRARFS